MIALLSRPLLYLNSDHNRDSFDIPESFNSGLRCKASQPQHPMSGAKGNLRVKTHTKTQTTWINMKGVQIN